MKRSVILALAVKFLMVSLLLLFLGAEAQTRLPRQVIRIDTGWRFSLGHASDPSRDFNYRIANIFSKSGKAENTAIDRGFDDSSWRRVNVPHDWAVELPFGKSDNADVMAHGYKPVGGLFPATSVGWYRNSFRAMPADSGRRFFLRFDGVFRDAIFWLNGFYLGRNESGYMGVTWDVTDYVDFHRVNTLVVRVDATQYEGWFYEGAGIYRDAWLITTGGINIPEDGVFAWSEMKGNGARVVVETTLRNNHLEPAGAWHSVILFDKDGKPVGEMDSEPAMIPARDGQERKIEIFLNNPHLWDIDDPYLYKVVVRAGTGTVVTDSIAFSFGIRTLRFDPATGFYLNDRNIKIFGVNCHQDHAGVGAAIPDGLNLYRMRLLKEMGVNAYRSSHNPPAPGLLDICDSLGILVMDEHRLLNSSPEYAVQLEKLIRRDRNHPSVFLWSIGNEEGWMQTNSFGKRVAQSLAEIQRKLDPTRTCTYAADLPNVFHGINEVIPVRSFNYRQFAISDYHRDHPWQPILGTEMGSTVTTRGEWRRDTVKCYLPDQDITAPWWASTAEEWWKLCAVQPWWMGGFIWTGFDYRGEPTPFSWPNINSHFGVMDMCGFPKNIYYYYKSWWSGSDVLHISPHWNNPGGVSEGDTVKVWVNSNADEVELKLNGRSFGTRRMPVNGHLSWSVPYSPGKLEAIASKGGKKWREVTETTGNPVTLLLEKHDEGFAANGRDVVIINVSALDEKGRRVPDASGLVEFLVSGPARIIGVGNGDPSSHEPDQCQEGKCKRHLFNGRCQVILQSETTPGNIEFRARSGGLREASLSFETR